MPGTETFTMEEAAAAAIDMMDIERMVRTGASGGSICTGRRVT